MKQEGFLLPLENVLREEDQLVTQESWFLQLFFVGLLWPLKIPDLPSASNFRWQFLYTLFSGLKVRLWCWLPLLQQLHPFGLFRFLVVRLFPSTLLFLALALPVLSHSFSSARTLSSILLSFFAILLLVRSTHQLLHLLPSSMFRAIQLSSNFTLSSVHITLAYLHR